jgi:Sec-independent protein secretion pathway component TatC
MTRFRAPRYDEGLTLVEHLDELRTRIIVSIVVLGVAVSLCFWQNHLLLDALNGPLPAGKKPVTLSPSEPFLLFVPALFVAGVAFGYYVVLPGALHFLLNFNSDQFTVQVRAGDYYGFVTLTLLAMGIVFQVPMGILALTKLGITTPCQLAGNRRYAYLILAIVAMALPGTDPVTMLVELVPLLLLYELSIVLARAFGAPVTARPAHQEGR